MTDNVKRWWLDMTEHELFNHLTKKKKYPPPIVASIVARVKVAREARRVERIREAQIKNHWAKVIDPARAELRTVRVIKHQTKSVEPIDEAKWNALCHYETLIGVLIGRLRKAMKDDDGKWRKPSQVVAERKAKGLKAIPPNEGAHWTDWVTPAERAAVMDLFKQVKQSKRGRTKEPFARTIPRKQYLAERAAFIQRLQADLANAEQEYEVTTDPQAQEKLNDLIQQMHHANYLIDKLEPNAPLPATWHGLLK